MSCLNSKREKGLWTWVGLNFPLVSTKDVLRLALVEGVHQGMGAILDIREKEHQKTQAMR